MTAKAIRTALVAAVSLAGMSSFVARADYPVEWQASVTAGAGSSDFAPSYMSALTHGRVWSNATVQAEAAAWRPLDTSQRFSYGFCADVIAGWAHDPAYDIYDAATSQWDTHTPRTARAWVQQLYGEVKYRAVFLTVGAKEYSSALLNQELTSGDLVHSGNTRPIPQARAGFIDFQDIPFTNGWVQISGEVGYGKYTDGDWWTSHFNYYNHHVVSGQWYNYKNCFFRTNPRQPFSATVGMQAADQFGGTYWQYAQGHMSKMESRSVTFNTLVHALFPWQSGQEGFYEGNHLGSWDLHLRYRLPSGDMLKAYLQKPFEDGSGIGWMNGWDGLWGLEWRRADGHGQWIEGALFEYIDLTNQSGPIHYAPHDRPGETIGMQASGGDDYYNNPFYNSYAAYGLSQGSPLVMAPVYNLDGYMAYIGNRMRGFHLAATGWLGNSLKWRLRGGWRKAYGNGFIMLRQPLHTTSMALDVDWNVKSISGLTVAGQLAFDNGNLPGNAFGALVTVKYSGTLHL